jgi:eukaryotic-like serine/threonine-protein kinase
MPQMCPKCGKDNRDTGQYCAFCQAPLRQLLGLHSLLQNRYEVIGVLGCGGMGAVYLALDHNLDNASVAIKENFDASAESQSQFRREAVVLARLDHPNLPKVSNHFIEQNDRQYLVMEYVAGDDLETQLERSGVPFPEAQVLAWVDTLLDALIYLHGQPQPIIHRDIKPGNIKITLDGKPKLVDFGLVKILDPRNPATSTALRGIATPEYAPMEQYSGTQHTDPRSDIYSLGATLYHLLTGQAPIMASLRGAQASTMPMPRQLNPSLSSSTEMVVMKAMELQMDKRFQSALEMRQALKGQSVPFTQPRRWLLVGVVCAILLTAGFLLLRGPLGTVLQTPTPTLTVTPSPTLTLMPTATTTYTPTFTWTPTATSILPNSTSTMTRTSTPRPIPARTIIPTETPSPPCPDNYFWNPVMNRCQSLGGGGPQPTVYP